MFIHFEGVESAFYLWVNGEKIGYRENSYTSSEFNITRFLRAGLNQISVEVYRWCTGSYLENQDITRLAGIFRSVYLFSTPTVHVRDFRLTSVLDGDYTDASLDVEVTLRDYGEALIPGAALMLQSEVGPPNSDIDLKGTVAVRSPRLWSAEQPNIYRIVLQLVDPTGAVNETLSQQVGFRDAAIVDGVFRINGKTVSLGGVNRHEWDPRTGRTLTTGSMIEDILLMRQNNINAVRRASSLHGPALFHGL